MNKPRLGLSSLFLSVPCTQPTRLNFENAIWASTGQTGALTLETNTRVMQLWPLGPDGDLPLLAAARCVQLLAQQLDDGTKKALRLVDKRTRDEVDGGIRRLRVSSAQLAHLAAVVPRFPLLSDLIVVNSSRARITDALSNGISNVYAALSDPQRLTGFEVQGLGACNRLALYTMDLMAYALSTLCDLTRLCLPDLNPAHSIGAARFVQAATCMPRLQHLNLQEFSLGTKGSEALADALVLRPDGHHAWQELQVRSMHHNGEASSRCKVDAPRPHTILVSVICQMVRSDALRSCAQAIMISHSLFGTTSIHILAPYPLHPLHSIPHTFPSTVSWFKTPTPPPIAPQSLAVAHCQHAAILALVTSPPPKLQQLRLTRCNGDINSLLHPPAPSGLSSSLTTLELIDSLRDINMRASFAALRTLVLWDSNHLITTHQAEELAASHLPSLRWFKTRNLTAGGLAVLRDVSQWFPRLEELALDGSTTGDALAEELALTSKPMQLHALGLANVGLTNAGLGSLAERPQLLQGLTRLDLSRNAALGGSWVVSDAWTRFAATPFTALRVLKLGGASVNFQVVAPSFTRAPWLGGLRELVLQFDAQWRWLVEALPVFVDLERRGVLRVEWIPSDGWDLTA